MGKAAKGLILFVCLVTFAVAPATAQVNTELSGTIEFMVWGNARSNEIDQMVIDAFQAKYPNIKVELRNPGGNHKEQLLTSIAGGLAPDIAIVDFYDLPELIEAGLIFDVTAWAERDGIYDEIRAELHPAVLGEMEYKGRLYSVANLRIAPDGLFYNKNLFNEAGLPYPTDDWTIEDMREAAIRLTRKNADGEVTQWGIEFHRFFIWPFIRMNGGRLFDPEGTYSPFDEPEVYEALQWLADIDLVHDAIAWNPYERAGAFSEGLAGMHIMWVGNLIVGLRDSVTWDWDIAPIPAGKLGSIGTVKGNPVVILNASQNKELAWEFMKFLGSEEAQYIYGREGRFYPLHRSALARVIQDSAGLPPANLASVMTWYAEPLPAIPGFSQVQDMWHEELEPVWFGETSAKTAGERIRQRSAVILEEVRRK